ncbi:MAG: hypothetical protein QXI89_01215 [Candidatus Anstonellales archaeon]
MSADNAIKIWNEFVKAVSEGKVNEEKDLNLLNYDFPFKSLIKAHIDSIKENAGINNEVIKKALPIWARIFKKIHENKKKINEIISLAGDKKHVIEKAIVNGYVHSRDISKELKDSLNDIGIIVIDHPNDKEIKEQMEFIYHDGYFYLLRQSLKKEIKDIIKKKEAVSNELQVLNAKRYVGLSKEEQEAFEKRQVDYLECIKKLEMFPRIKI